MKLTIHRAETLINHLKETYKKWYRSLSKTEKKETNNWNEFVRQSVKINNENNGTDEDFIFIAEDALRNI